MALEWLKDSWTRCAVLLVFLIACSDVQVPAEQIAVEWPEGLIAEYTELKSQCFAVEDDAIRYTYRLPRAMDVGSAIERLRGQIERSGYRHGVPLQSCFEVLEQRTDWLVMRCSNPANNPRDVWIVRVKDDIATVIAGSARAVLTYRVCQ